MLRLTTAGESHGPAMVAVLDGVPAGIRLSQAALDRELARRQAGYGRGGRMKIETDHAEVLAGVRFGVTLGSPVAIIVRNRDHANWQETMSTWKPPPPDLVTVTRPRPGHADLAGLAKYGGDDIRNVLERASARETAARVAAGAVVKMLLAELGIWVGSQVRAIGPAIVAPDRLSRPQGDLADYQDWQATVDASPVRCGCPEATAEMIVAIDQAREQGHSLGGTFEVLTNRPPPGLGSYTQWDRRLDGALAQATLSIPGIKGVEIGDGFAVSRAPGNQAHDAIHLAAGRLTRATNRAGGLEGGVSNGEPLVIHCAMKPIATQSQPLATVDLATLSPALAHKERADVCAVASAAVAAEAMVAITLAAALLAKFGGDSLHEIRANIRHYLAQPLPSLHDQPDSGTVNR